MSKASSAQQDRLRTAAASPALDSSGGNLPPISHDTKATAENDDDGDNNSTQDIDSLLQGVLAIPSLDGSAANTNTLLFMLGRQQLS